MKLFGGNGHNDDRQPKPEAAHRAKSEGTGKSAASKALKGFVTALIIVAVIAGCGFAYWKITTKPPESNPPVGDSDLSDGEQGGAVNIVDTPDREIGRYYTVLVAGEDQLGVNTDTIMLARYDTVEKKANIVSIPRDTVINTENGSSKKINSVFYVGGEGIESLKDEVARITGFRPDSYVVLDIDVFCSVVDAIGGVEFDVPINMNYDDYATYPNGEPYEFTIHLEKGLQTLSGYDALGVFRFRQNNDKTGYPMGDIQRLDCQHDLMMAIAKNAMETRNVATLMSIVKAVLDNCETDLTLGNIQWYVEQFFSMSLDDIQFFTAPSTGCWIGNTTYVTLNTDDWITMVNERINPLKAPIEAKDCALLYLSKQKDLINGQLYIEPDELAITNGEEIYLNFSGKK